MTAIPLLYTILHHDAPDKDISGVQPHDRQRFFQLLTPAFWLGQAWQHQALGTFSDLHLGRSLVEELAACLLGGFGMPAELGLATYRRLRDRGLLNDRSSAGELERSLSEPFVLDGRPRRYRFPRQRAIFLAGCLADLDGFPEPDDDGELRDHLTAMRGIGPKTASGIVRNYRASNAVAIIDVHILRACRHMGLFPSEWLPSKHDRQLECKFLEFAAALQTPASLLDGLIWHYSARPSTKGCSTLRRRRQDCGRFLCRTPRCTCWPRGRHGRIGQPRRS